METATESPMIWQGCTVSWSSRDERRGTPIGVDIVKSTYIRYEPCQDLEHNHSNSQAEYISLLADPSSRIRQYESAQGDTSPEARCHEADMCGIGIAVGYQVPTSSHVSIIDINSMNLRCKRSTYEMNHPDSETSTPW